ncbi:MAG: hypothetical protein AB9891_02600 [Anaerolineaceae bacterium]
MKTPVKLLISALIVAAVAGGYFYLRRNRVSPALTTFREWINNPEDHPDWAMHPGQVCGGAPFAFPTTGYIGFVWEDSFRPGHRHQGIDIFGGEEPGVTEVRAAYEGYLTRQQDWKSTVIIRIPSDPLNPGPANLDLLHPHGRRARQILYCQTVSNWDQGSVRQSRDAAGLPGRIIPAHLTTPPACTCIFLW